MPTISKISARPITDSRGEKTLEVTVVTRSERVGVAAVPSGTSTGSFEAEVLPVEQSIRIIEELLSPKLTGAPVDDQKEIDRRLIALDGTERKERLGGNTLIGVSLAVARAAAQELNLPLYRYIAALADTSVASSAPLCVVIEGGKHSQSERLTFQEFLVGGQLEKAQDIYNFLAGALGKKTGLEGALAPDISNSDALNVLTEAKTTCDKESEVILGIDFAATTLVRPPDVSEIVELVHQYPIGLLEDPLPEEAWHLWGQLNLELTRAGKEILLVGDDLFVTNRRRLEKGVTRLVANSILIKPNQVGTLTETLDVIKLAKRAGFKHIVSHRSGETMDDFIADLAVGTAASYLKAGAPVADFPERTVKYSRLAEIEKELTAI